MRLISGQGLVSFSEAVFGWVSLVLDGVLWTCETLSCYSCSQPAGVSLELPGDRPDMGRYGREAGKPRATGGILTLLNEVYLGLQTFNPDLIPGSGRSPGEGNGNPLQYSCLENSMDRGTWWATVHGAAKSWTWLSDWHLLCEPRSPLYCFTGMNWGLCCVHIMDKTIF